MGTQEIVSQESWRRGQCPEVVGRRDSSHRTALSPGMASPGDRTPLLWHWGLKFPRPRAAPPRLGRALVAPLLTSLCGCPSNPAAEGGAV